MSIGRWRRPGRSHALAPPRWVPETQPLAIQCNCISPTEGNLPKRRRMAEAGPAMPTESESRSSSSATPTPTSRNPGRGRVMWSSAYRSWTGYLGPAIKFGPVEIWLDRLMPGGDWQLEMEQELLRTSAKSHGSVPELMAATRTSLSPRKVHSLTARLYEGNRAGSSARACRQLPRWLVSASRPPRCRISSNQQTMSAIPLARSTPRS
jgi:hypothetical protein